MASNKVNPLEDWESEELSEAELDLLAGGFLPTDFNTSLSNPSLPAPGSTPQLTPLDAATTAKFENAFKNDVVISPVAARVDSSYTSYFGALGTTVSHPGGHPLNITNRFP
jgi:hypothetical protein